MGKRGPKPGSPKTGGRKKGSVNKGVTAKYQILQEVQEYFATREYNPLKELVDLAKKDWPGKHDGHKVMVHLALLKKICPDLTALQADINVTQQPPEHTDEVLRTKRIQDLEKKRTAVMPLELLAGEPGSREDL